MFKYAVEYDETEEQWMLIVTNWAISNGEPIAAGVARFDDESVAIKACDSLNAVGHLQNPQAYFDASVDLSKKVFAFMDTMDSSASKKPKMSDVIDQMNQANVVLLGTALGESYEDDDEDEEDYYDDDDDGEEEA